MRQMTTVEARLFRIRLIEKMQKQEGYSGKLGLENVSRFRGKQVEKEMI